MTHTRLVVFLVSSFNSVSVLALEHHTGVAAAKDGGKAVLLRTSFVADPCTCYCDFSEAGLVFRYDASVQFSQTLDTT